MIWKISISFTIFFNFEDEVELYNQPMEVMDENKWKE